MSNAQLCARYSRDTLSQPLREFLLPVRALSTEVIAVAESKLGVSSPMVIGLSVGHDILPESGSQFGARPQKSALKSAYSDLSEPRGREPWRQASSVVRGARGL
jgi:hypothetical protein